MEPKQTIALLGLAGLLLAGSLAVSLLFPQSESPIGQDHRSVELAATAITQASRRAVRIVLTNTGTDAIEYAGDSCNGNALHVALERKENNTGNWISLPKTCHTGATIRGCSILMPGASVEQTVASDQLAIGGTYRFVYTGSADGKGKDCGLFDGAVVSNEFGF